MKKLLFSIALGLLSYWSATAGSEASGGLIFWYVMTSVFSGLGGVLLFTFYIDEK